jgi:hypothetical protein
VDAPVLAFHVMITLLYEVSKVAFTLPGEERPRQPVSEALKSEHAVDAHAFAQ